MELIFLGTGAGLPSKSRNVTSIALSLLDERKSIWLFDCGEATQHQILKSTIKLSKLEKIFITHMHGDHIFGLPGLLSSRSFQGKEKPITIYGPKGIQEYVESALRLSGTHLSYTITFEEIEPGLLFADDTFSVSCDLLDHGIASYGYRIVQKDKPGALYAEKLQEIGVPPGPIFQAIKKGESVKLEDGRTIDGSDYIGPSQAGKIIAIYGDTRQIPVSLELGENADVIVHEATFEAGLEKLAHEYMHSTTHQAAELAKETGAKRLIITHISARYDKEGSGQLLEEARSIFPETELANDFSRFTI